MTTTDLTELKDTDILKVDLAKRAIDNSFIATSVIPMNPVALFGEGTDLNAIMTIVSKYYMASTEPITKTTLNLELTRQFESNPKLKKLDQQQQLNMLKLAGDLIDTSYDSSSKMTDAVDKYVRNALASSAILEEASKAGRDDYDIVESLSHRLDVINSINLAGKGDKPTSVVGDLDDRAKLYEEFNVAKVKMGIEPFDEATRGGMAKGEVALIGAKSGTGKSTILSNISVSYAKRGYNVFQISLEELKSMMQLRFDRLLLKNEVKQILDPLGRVNQSWLEYSAMLYKTLYETHRIGEITMHKGTPQTVTVDKLRQIILTAEREKELKYDVVVVDYPDLMLNKHSTDSESADGGRLFEELRSLAQELNVVMWTATQLNRMTNGASLLTLGNVEGSYRKINTVEFGGTINVSKAEKENGFMRVYLDKLRNRLDYIGDTLYLKYNQATGEISSETEAQHLVHLDLLENENTSWQDSSTKASNSKKYAKPANPQAESSIL